MPDVIVTELNLILRLLVACALAGILGWEREQARKPAGLRTHMLVGVASALFAILAELAVSSYQEAGAALRFDPIRAIEAVATGIGFLGAATVFVTRGREGVRGLTTAASIWATAAVGVAAGLQHYVLAIGAVAILLVVLRFFSRFDIR